MKPRMLTRSAMGENFGVSVLTPTTLKSITQILESESCLQHMQGIGSEESNHRLPPLLEENNYSIPSVIMSSGNGTRNTFVTSDSKCWQGGTTTVLTPTSLLPQTVLEKTVEERSPLPPSPPLTSVSRKKSLVPRRNGGGRKPSSLNKNGSTLSPEEEARVRIRRQRNKEAAARCRKRRVDQTNELLEQVEEHERVKKSLQEEIRALQCAKEELEFLLETHSSSCKLTGDFRVKEESNAVVDPIHEGFINQKPLSRPESLIIPNRPSTLDIPIDTPSSIINFDSILTSSTGFTPLGNIATPVLFSTSNTASLNTPTCSVQQRNTEQDKSANETSTAPNLVSL